MFTNILNKQDRLNVFKSALQSVPQEASRDSLTYYKSFLSLSPESGTQDCIDPINGLNCLCDVTLLMETVNNLVGKKEPNCSNNSLHNNSQDSHLKNICWEKYFKGQMPKSLESKPAQKSLWGSGKGPIIMRYYSEHKDVKALSNISEELKKKFTFNCARNTIRSFILGVLEDTQQMHSNQSNTSELSQPDQEEASLLEKVDWDEYFRGEMPDSIKGKPKQEDIWNDSTGMKLMKYYSKNIEKETFTKISKDLYNKCSYSLSTIKRFIENVIKDVSEGRPRNKNRKMEPLTEPLVRECKRKLEDDYISVQKRRRVDESFFSENVRRSTCTGEGILF
jgi:hypothetical protein